MASPYPAALPSYTAPITTDHLDSLTVPHASETAKMQTDIVAIAATLGTNPQGSSASVKARIAAIEADGWAGSARILPGYAAKTGTYTATIADSILNVTSGTFTINLYAVAGQTGRRLLVRNGGSGVVTLDGNAAETIAGAATLVLGGYGWVELVCTGSAWLVVDGAYWDETVGRREYRWNHGYSTGAGGWQMVWGDTGLRDVTSLVSAVSNLTTSRATLRRRGSQVELAVRFTTAASSGGGSWYTPPSGFGKFTSSSWDESYVGARAGTGGNNGTGVLSAASGASLWRLDWAGLSGGACFVKALFDTPDAWPSSLPGSAIGSIP